MGNGVEVNRKKRLITQMVMKPCDAGKGRKNAEKFILNFTLPLIAGLAMADSHIWSLRLIDKKAREKVPTPAPSPQGEGRGKRWSPGGSRFETWLRRATNPGSLVYVFVKN